MSYILDSIKALFTKNTTNAASQSGARVPIMSADGTPIGVDTMAGLASVLGVIQYEIGTKTLPNNTDLNTIGLSRQRKGFDVFDIQCDSTTSNAPFLGRCILLVFGQSASNYIVQIALNVTASTNAVNIKVRGSFVISSGWGEWRTVALN